MVNASHSAGLQPYCPYGPKVPEFVPAIDTVTPVEEVNGNLPYCNGELVLGHIVRDSSK